MSNVLSLQDVDSEFSLSEDVGLIESFITVILHSFRRKGRPESVGVKEGGSCLVSLRGGGRRVGSPSMSGAPSPGRARPETFQQNGAQDNLSSQKPCLGRVCCWKWSEIDPAPGAQ